MSPRSFRASSGERYVELPPQRRFHADLDVVVIDKHRDIQFFLHSISLNDIGASAAGVPCYYLLSLASASTGTLVE